MHKTVASLRLKRKQILDLLIGQNPLLPKDFDDSLILIRKRCLHTHSRLQAQKDILYCLISFDGWGDLLNKRYLLAAKIGLLSELNSDFRTFRVGLQKRIFFSSTTLSHSADNEDDRDRIRV
jgi:hypothetical protein